MRKRRDSSLLDSKKGSLSSKDLGKKIAGIRREAGFTNRAALAERTGLSEQQIKMIETGRRRPSEDSLAWIAIACRLTLEQFKELQGHAFGIKGVWSVNAAALAAVPGYAEETEQRLARALSGWPEQESRYKREHDAIIDTYLTLLPGRRRTALKKTTPFPVHREGGRPLVPPEVAWLLVMFHRFMVKAGIGPELNVSEDPKPSPPRRRKSKPAS